MNSATIRYTWRFLIALLISTALTLCLISTFRIVYVHRSLENAVKYAAAGRADRVVRELRLAAVWAPAYPSLQGPVQRLYRSAVSQTGLQIPIPVVPPRSFAASLPPLEKAMIPADHLVYALYKHFGPGGRLPQGELSLATAESRPVMEQPGIRNTATGSTDHPPAAPRKPHRQTEPPPLPSDEDPATGRPEPPEVSFPVAEEPPAEMPDPSTEPPGPVPDREAVWGVVINPNTSVYNQTGARIRTVPAGSLVDVLRLQTVASGEVVSCSIWSRTGNFQNVILRRSDVELYFGTLLSATTRQQRELASRRAELIAAIEARRQSVSEGGNGRNPHQEDYRSVLIEYKAIDDEAGKLKAEFDNASGSRRMEVANRLRILKNEQARLMPRYHDIRQKKEAWEQKNRERHSPADPDRDPELQAMLHQLDEINEQLRDL